MKGPSLSPALAPAQDLNQQRYEQALKTKKATLICMYSETPGYITSVEGKSPAGVLPHERACEASKTTKNIALALDY